MPEEVDPLAANDDVLSGDSVVLRVVKQPHMFFPAGAEYPTHDCLLRSDREKEDAKKSGKPIRVSVWDNARTTPSQIVAIRRKENEVEKESTLIVFAFSVATAQQIAQKHGVMLRVVRDPLPELAGVPGGDGHCGVEGLDRESPNSNKAKSASIRDEIVRTFRSAGSSA